MKFTTHLGYEQACAFRPPAGSVLDEIPGAYKNIDEVVERQKDLVEVVHTLKQVLCVKGT